ncbi:MAG: ATP-binding protein [Vampirovibrionia bacterium]
MVVTRTQAKTLVLKGKPEVKSGKDEDVAALALKFSDLQPRKEKDAEKQENRSLPEKLARKVVNFERHPTKKVLAAVFSFSGLGLILNSFIDKKMSARDKLLSIVGAIPLVFSDIFYKDLLNPAAKKLIPKNKEKQDFDPDRDMIFSSAKFKENLFHGISRFIGASDPKRIELDLGQIKKKSPTMLFVGPPGVGKTEIAGYVAKKMGRELQLVGSNMTGGFIGETERNLISAFEEAKKKNQLLFFDEADTLCSQRNEAAAMSERGHGNKHDIVVVNTLLKLIDDSGVPVILATNSGNIDTAIKSRMKVTVVFPEPTPEQNYEIMLSKFRSMNMKDSRLQDFIQHKATLIKAFSAFKFSPRDVMNVVEAAIERVDFRVGRAERAGADALAKVDSSINLEDIKIELERLQENLRQASRSHMGGRSPLLNALGV